MIDKPGVFASSSLEQALCSLQYWDDDMFEQGTIGDDPLYFREKNKNQLIETYEGKEGWLYVLDASTFIHEDNFMNTEMVSYSEPKIVKKYHIKNALKALKDSKLKFFSHEDDSFNEYIK